MKLAGLLALLCLAPVTRPRMFLAWDACPPNERRLNLEYWVYRSTDQVNWGLAYKTMSTTAPIPFITTTVFWKARAHSLTDGLTSNWSMIARQN